jgi:hypothetical protein
MINYILFLIREVEEEVEGQDESEDGWGESEDEWRESKSEDEGIKIEEELKEEDIGYEDKESGFALSNSTSLFLSEVLFQFSMIF